MLRCGRGLHLSDLPSRKRQCVDLRPRAFPRLPIALAWFCLIFARRALGESAYPAYQPDTTYSSAASLSSRLT